MALTEAQISSINDLATICYIGESFNDIPTETKIKMVALAEKIQADLDDSSVDITAEGVINHLFEKYGVK